MITYLCAKEPQAGTLSGSCVVCGVQTETGHELPFSDSFTGYSFLIHGNCTCSHCFAFFRDQSFRKRSWVATEKEVLFPKRLEFGSYIIDPPEPPFAMYVTQTGQRQGWLSGLKCLSHSREKFYVLTDFVGSVLADRSEAAIMNNLVEQLREKGVSKTQLLDGEYTMYTYRKAIEGNWQDLAEEAKKYTKNPLWEVLVYVGK